MYCIFTPVINRPHGRKVSPEEVVSFLILTMLLSFYLHYCKWPYKDLRSRQQVMMPTRTA